MSATPPHGHAEAPGGRWDDMASLPTAAADDRAAGPPPPADGWEARLAAERASLRRVAAAVVARAEAGGALDLAASEVATLMGAEQGFVFRLVEGDRVMVAGAAGVEAAPIGAVHGMLPAGVIPEVVRRRVPVRIEGRLRPLGRENSDRYWIAPVYRGGVGAPVFVGDALWGVMVVATTRDAPFPAGAEDRLDYFAEIAGIAIGTAEANERLARLAMSDALTGLANNRAFQASLDAEVERARRHGRPLALAVIDLDHFKWVNDTHGHLAGDTALMEIASRLSAEGRRGDLIARVGGEEFAWVLPETDLASALRVAERARRAAASRPVPVVGRVTLSIGVAELAQAGDAAELYRLADEALYRAKRSGRDRCVAYDAGVAPETAAPGGHPVGSGAVARALSRAIGAREPGTRAHGERVARLVERMARAAGWPADRAVLLAEAGLVHEIGTLGVPAALRHAPADPASREADLLRRHLLLGAGIVADVMTPEQVAWVRAHAERHDGSGQPDGLAGDEIPEGARLIAVADVWDALISEGATPTAARAELAARAGTWFDPAAARLLDAAVRGERAWPVPP